MTHQQATTYERRKVRLGVRMTLLYALIYLGFVVLSVFLPGTIAGAGLFGLNLALTYGILLIVLAVIMALVYNHLCGISSAGQEV